MAKKSLARVEDEQSMPAFLKSEERADMQNIELQRDTEIPRIVLLQGLSPEVVEGAQDSENPKITAQQGMLWHRLAGRCLAEPGEALIATPILVRRRFVLWDPAGGTQNGDILARSDDGITWNPPRGEAEVKIDKKTKVTWKWGASVEESGLDKFGSSDPSDPNSVPAAVLCYDFLLHLRDFPELSPSVLILQRTQIKPTKKILGKLKLGSVPIYGRLISILAVEDHNSVGQAFYNYRFGLQGFVQNEDLFNRLKELNERYADHGFNVEVAPEEAVPEGDDEGDEDIPF